MRVAEASQTQGVCRALTLPPAFCPRLPDLLQTLPASLEQPYSSSHFVPGPGPGRVETTRG